jgi:hypothetical protein
MPHVVSEGAGDLQGLFHIWIRRVRCEDVKM